jgi:hypothetical protein
MVYAGNNLEKTGGKYSQSRSSTAAHKADDQTADAGAAAMAT